MKYTLSSQEYNELFRTASETFDAELIKRDLAIKNMSKKLMIIDYANEFIERKLARYNLYLQNLKKCQKKVLRFLNFKVF